MNPRPILRARGGEEELGFTLIELLVALAVFGLAAMALLNVAVENTRTASTVTSRALADIVAENQAVRIMIAPGPLDPGSSAGSEAQGGRLWRWTRRVTATSEPDLLRVDIAVAEQNSDASVSTLTLFRGRR
jgi:general secretion pathway protein I